jgi:hypothetical protein
MYNCKECANRATLVCDKCTSITKPSGAETRPTEFVKLIPLDQKEKLKVNILAYLERGKPIPVAMVFEYNDISSEE